MTDLDQAWLDELFAWIRIPSVSADPAHSDDVRAAGEWVCEFVRGAGGTAELVETGAQPLAVGEIRASREPDGAPTVLLYGHFDVQPPAPLELWESPPFEPELRGDWLYGRGVLDDKGNAYLMLKAAQILADENELPVNVRVVFDGEEEVGGDSVVQFLAADERGADSCLIFDGGFAELDVPAFELGTRGLLYFHVRLRSGERDLHSGVFGGAALNAVHALTSRRDASPRRRRLPSSSSARPAQARSCSLAASTARNETPARHSSRSTAPRSPTRCWSRSSSGTRPVRSPGPACARSA